MVGDHSHRADDPLLQEPRADQDGGQEGRPLKVDVTLHELQIYTYIVYTVEIGYMPFGIYRCHFVYACYMRAI